MVKRAIQKKETERERERTKLIQSGEMAAGLSSRALFLSINNNNNNYHQHHCSQTFRFSFEERRGRRRVSRSRSFSSLPLSLSTSNRVSSPSSRPVLCQSSSTDLDVAAQAGQDRLLKVRSNFYFFFCFNRIGSICFALLLHFCFGFEIAGSSV